ncbi:MAG: ribosome maturation factor RimM [Levilactobacillus sp.]|uniref:Ribosome maturation factor RimM n=1 Tax=Levilactobacillus suantsaiihabitans TaxID=2487722 RepID=A0A4Z0J627_9LACO|nr:MULTISPECIES: ribosome maturation factor RimM [Levilactobacillus]MCH4123424.1 ribosome maturation factor RimM [Levilactobacillus sp.]MCI1552438.1 ribosome maturation factor RimM [Levilactobacillus sp.]MCI1599025.1 ribosome maturation factor RimM [Levilactobacillus sp.]MCI1606059.1 ribosome maturation factor RimM [Levilactobacillus sp.]TGD17903.1 ribosome maturation factor RimM [Levilactobacillus suantsaiihabitans]
MAYYTVGTIVNTHGIKGEVRVIATTDFPESRFAVGSTLYAFQKGQTQPTQLTVATMRKHKNFYLLGFVDKPSINDVEIYKQSTLKVTDNELAASDLQPGEYYYHQIVGLQVVTVDGEKLGEIKEILSPGANDVWVVARPGKDDLLLPKIDDVVKKVDLDAGQVTVELMEGLE